MTKHANSKAQQILKYVAKNPKAKAQEIATALSVNVAYVYTVMWGAKKKATAAKRTTLTLPKIKKAMSEHNQMMDDTIKGWKTLSITTSNTPMQIEMFDPVSNPAHYVAGGIQTIDFIEAKKLGYNLGNVVKYLTRADHKGNRKEDLEKAKWYLERELSATT